MKLGEILYRFAAKDGREFIIRIVQEDELENVRHLFIQTFTEDKYPSIMMQEKYRKYPSLFIGCFNKDEIVGTVFGWPDPEILVVKAIVVIKLHRRKGTGTALLKSFENTAKREGFDSFVLGAEWEAVPFYISCGLECFANVQIIPEKIPWDNIQRLRSKYNITGAAVFGTSISSNFISKLNRELKVKVKTVKSEFESISIQIMPEEITKEALELMKRDFNAYATQFAFKKNLSSLSEEK